jgi:hypothetical protein
VSIWDAPARRESDTAKNGRKAFGMNPYGGYQGYQVQRTKTRAEILADDARRGRQAAAVIRGGRALAYKAITPGIVALNAIRATAAHRPRAASLGEARGTACSSE